MRDMISYAAALLLGISGVATAFAEPTTVEPNTGGTVEAQAVGAGNHDAASNGVRNTKARSATDGDDDGDGRADARVLGEGTGTKGGKALADVVTNSVGPGDDPRPRRPNRADIGSELHPPGTAAAPIREGGKTVDPNSKKNTAGQRGAHDRAGHGRAGTRQEANGAGRDSARARGHEAAHTVQQGATREGGDIELGDVRGETAGDAANDTGE